MELAAGVPASAPGPSQSSPPMSDVHSDGSSHTTSNGIDASSSPAAPWPSLQSLLLDAACDAEQLPYVTYEEADDTGVQTPEQEDGEEDGEHWLDAAFSSSCSFSSPLASRSPPSSPPPSVSPSLTAALRFLQQRHRAHIERHRLSSPAWQQLKRNTAQFLTACDRAQSLPAADRPLPSAADIAALDSAAVVKQLNPLLTPCIPPLPPMPAAPRAVGAETFSASSIAERSRKRRRVTSSSSASRPLSAQLLSGPLGRHALQLLHIHALKRGIEQEHGARLDRLVEAKRRRNAETVRRQQDELAARERRRQQQTAGSQPAATLPASDAALPPASSSTAAMTTELSSAAAASMPPLEAPSPSAGSLPSPPAAPSRAGNDSTVSLSSALSFASSSASLLPTAAAADSMSEPQLLSALHPILSVFFLHRGFTSFSRHALLVMAQACVDFIRTAGRAIRDWADDRGQGRRSSRRREKAAADVGSKAAQNGRAEGGEAEQAAAGRRLLQQLGIESERSLRVWYEQSIVSAGARIRRTELRLLHLQERLSGGAEPVSLIAEEAAGGFGCEPFSPLRSFVSPPALPPSPPPLDDEKSEVMEKREDNRLQMQDVEGKAAEAVGDEDAARSGGGAQDVPALSGGEAAASASAGNSRDELSSRDAMVEGLANEAASGPEGSSSVGASNEPQLLQQQEPLLPPLLETQQMAD